MSENINTNEQQQHQQESTVQVTTHNNDNSNTSTTTTTTATTLSQSTSSQPLNEQQQQSSITTTTPQQQQQHTPSTSTSTSSNNSNTTRSTSCRATLLSRYLMNSIFPNGTWSSSTNKNEQQQQQPTKFKAKSKLFDKLIKETASLLKQKNKNTQNTTTTTANNNTTSTNSSSLNNMKTLMNILRICENYYYLMANHRLIFDQSPSSTESNDQQQQQDSSPPSSSSSTTTTASSLQSSSSTGGSSASLMSSIESKSFDSPYYLCSLCYHCLFEPITLICGCTYCKNCLDEYNKTQDKLNDNDCSYKCKTCSYEHNRNDSKYLNQNIIISKLNEKLFSKQIDIRLLRNDIKNYLIFNKKKFTINKSIILFEYAFNLDKTNHLLIADLFILNYFNKSIERCCELADNCIDLQPYWPFGYYMRSLCSNDISKIRDDLVECLSLDPTLTSVRHKLEQIRSLLPLTNQTPSDGISLISTTTTTPIGGELLIGASELIAASTSEEEDDNVKATGIKRSYSNTNNGDSSNDSMDLKKFHSQDSVTDENDSDEQQQQQQQQQQSSLINEDCSMTSSKSTLTTMEQSESNYKQIFVIDKDAIKTSDFECGVCMRLMYNPVSTDCGHMFCQSCLERALDHQDKCPLCKRPLSNYLAERRQFLNIYVDKMIRTYFPQEYGERKLQIEEELSEFLKPNEIAIFVCTLALPTVLCPLHVFEPKYRLMLRRALYTSKQFGMCVYTESNEYNYATYGCMLEIMNCEFIRDGRAVVETIGGRRFRVLERRVKDGYNVAAVEWIRDNDVRNDDERRLLQLLNKEVYDLAKQWYDYLPNEKKELILNSLGMTGLPDLHDNFDSTDNGPSWHWFLLHILPLDNELQLKFLSSTSLITRLSQLKMILRILLKSFERERQRNSSINAAAASSTSTSPSSPTPTTSNTQTTEQGQEVQQEQHEQQQSDDNNTETSSSTSTISAVNSDEHTTNNSSSTNNTNDNNTNNNTSNNNNNTDNSNNNSNS